MPADLIQRCDRKLWSHMMQHQIKGIFSGIFDNGMRMKMFSVKCCTGRLKMGLTTPIYLHLLILLLCLKYTQLNI
jgi:hypothetical protein